MNHKPIMVFSLVFIMMFGAPKTAQSKDQSVGLIIQSYAQAKSTVLAEQNRFIKELNSLLDNKWAVEVVAEGDIVNATEITEAVKLNVIDGMFARLKDFQTLESWLALVEKDGRWQSDRAFLDFMRLPPVEAWLQASLAKQNIKMIGIYLCEQYVVLAREPISELSKFKNKRVLTDSALLKKAFSANGAKLTKNLESGRDEVHIDHDLIAVPLAKAVSQKIYKDYSYLLPSSISPQAVCMFGINEKTWTSLALSEQQILMSRFQEFKKALSFNKRENDNVYWRTIRLDPEVKQVVWRGVTKAFFFKSIRFFLGDGLSQKQKFGVNSELSFSQLIKKYGTETGRVMW